MLLPLIYTQDLLIVQWHSRTLPPVPVASPPPQAVTHHAARTDRAAVRVFTAPSAIPYQIDTTIEQPLTTMSDDTPAMALGIEHAAGSVAALLGIPNRAVPPPPVAPQQPRAEQSAAPPVPVSSGVQAAKLLRRVLPVYPQLARIARVSGTVHLVGVIGKDGAIQHLQVIGGPALLVNAAADAVRQWVYRPTLLSGEPVEVVAPIDVVFTLN